MPNKRAQNPLLERLSWVASILSFVLGVLVWLTPSPIRFVATASQSPTASIETIFRVLLFAVFLCLGVALLIFSVIKPKGNTELGFYVSGDWGAFSAMTTGIMIMFSSLCYILWLNNHESEMFTIVSAILIFAMGAFSTIFGMKRNYGLLRGEGLAKVATRSDWFLIIGLIVAVSLLITGVVIILLIRLFALP